MERTSKEMTMKNLKIIAIALAVLADSPEFIEKSWQPLFSPQALQCDFLLFHPDETVPRASGWCNSAWEVDD